MDAFKQAYEGLNTEQKLAVDTIEGPLLVVAGPGTGKTQLLSVRVANILHKTDSSPQNILCLTFTNKAAHNMRERLFELIGPTAYDVVVRTFHSFAADIMSEYPDYFWNGAHLAVVPDAVQIEIIQTILAGLPLDNPLAQRFAGAFTGKNSVQDALKLTKEAGLTPAKLRAIINANLAYIDQIEEIMVEHLSPSLSFKKLAELEEKLTADLPEQPIDAHIAPLMSLRTVLLEKLAYAIRLDNDLGKTTNTGAWKRQFLQSVDGIKGMHKERERNTWWLALADVYEKYRDQLHERGYYDYADMLVEVITAVEKHGALRADLQERYQYVLIDEFQDTNPAQMRLAHLVADHPVSEGRPNLMAVGDDDQSIFKFNGAELNNMLEFRSFYKVEKPIVLTKNYRSTQAVLDVAKTVAEQATDRLVHRETDITKDLIAERLTKAQGTITHTLYPSRQHQLSAVARQIAKAKEGKGTVAVLARKHESLRSLAAVLHALNVPLRYERQSNILEHQAVRQVVLLAEILSAIQEGDEPALNNALSQSLRHPMWHIAPTTLWQLAIDNRYKPHWLKSLLAHEEKPLKTLGESLLALAQTAAIEPLGLTLEYIIGLRPHDQFKSPFYTYFLKDQPVTTTYTEALSAVQLLRSLADEFSRHNEASFADFVRFVRLNQAEKRLITDESVFVTGSDTVELLTVYKAKGLEFDTVFVIDAIEDGWKPAKGTRKPPANLPLQAAGEVIDDYIRLFYVALTRARHTFHVSGYTSDIFGKELLPVSFARTAIEPAIAPANDENLVTILEETSTWPALSSDDEKHILQPLLEDFSLAPTALINFLDVEKGGPQYFKERSLLRLPEARTTSQAFGIAIHSALETAQKLINQDAFDIDEVFQAYEDALDGEHLSRAEFERFVPEGQKVLGTLFESYGYELTKGSATEQKLTATLADGVQIDGKLDRIDLQDKHHLTIVDYKTGAPLTSFDAKGEKPAIKAWRHRTQLIFYALLARNNARYKDFSSVEGQMVYVEASSPKDLIKQYAPSDDEVERMAKLATAVWKKIQACDFPDVSGYAHTIEGITQFEEDLLSGNV